MWIMIKENLHILTPILVAINIILAIILFGVQRRRFIKEQQKMRNHMTALSLLDQNTDMMQELHKRGIISGEEAIKRIEEITDLVQKTTEGSIK